MILALAAAGCGFHRPAELSVRGLDPIDLGGDGAKILLVGDAGVRDPGDPTRPGPAPRGVAEAAVARCPDCDLVVWLGDNVYWHGVSRERDRAWLDGYAALWGGSPIALVLGNHDYGPIVPRARRARRELDWAEGARLSGAATNWWVDLGGLRLVGLDSDWWVRGPGRGRRCAGSQRACVERMEAALAESQRGSPEPAFTVVVAHHPIRSNGPHGDAGELRHSGLGAFRGEALAALHGALPSDAWISGHEHLLEAFPESAAFVVGSSGKVSEVARAAADGEWVQPELGYGLLIADGEALSIELVPWCAEGDCPAPACFQRRAGGPWVSAPGACGP